MLYKNEKGKLNEEKSVLEENMEKEVERRERLDIIAEILFFCGEPRRLREIKDGCRLKGKHLELVSLLLHGKFLKKLCLKDCDLYVTTLRGYVLLSCYKKLKRMLDVQQEKETSKRASEEEKS